MRTGYALQHVPHETLGSLETHLSDAGVAWHEVKLFSGKTVDLPWNWDQVAGLVILGGPMNVNEVPEYPFLRQELTWIQEAMHRELPVLGICLGAQLMARALGAEVFPNRTKEIAWYDIELLQPEDNSLFSLNLFLVIGIDKKCHK